MVKIAPSFLVVALTLASSSSLAAPTPISAPEHESASISEDATDAVANGGEPDKVEAAARLLAKKGQPPVIAQLDTPVGRPSSSDNMRRSIPLVATGNNFLERRQSLLKRDDLVTGLGLAGALAPLGLGGLLPTLEGVIGGLPLVGGPVGGLLTTLDGTVGISSLLNPAPPHAKRQVPVPDPLAGLLGGLTNGGLPLSGLTGQVGGLLPPLPLGQGSPVPQVAGSLPSFPLGQASPIAQTPVAQTPVGQAAQSAQSAAIGALLGQIQGGALPSPLGSLSIAQAEAYGLLPAGFTHNLAVKVVEHEVAAQQPGFANQFIATANNFHHHGDASTTNSTATENQPNTQPWATLSQLGTPVGALSLAPTPTTAILAAIPSAPAPASSAAATAVAAVPAPLAPVAAAAAGVAGGSVPAPASSIAATAAGRAPAPLSSAAAAGGSIPAPASSAAATARGAAPAPVSSVAAAAANAAPAPVAAAAGRVQTVDDRLEVVSPDDSGSEYSDDDDDMVDDDDEEDEVGQPRTAWKITSSTASSTMTQTVSQAAVTAQAMSMTSSEAGSTAVPTTTGAARRWAVNLD